MSARKDRDNVIENILKIVKNNPNKWISSTDIVELKGYLRQSINWAFRELENRGVVKRKKKDLNNSGTKINFIKYENDNDE